LIFHAVVLDRNTHLALALVRFRLSVLCLFFPLVGSYSHVFSPKRWGSPASLLTEILRSGHPDKDGKTRINVSQAEGISSAKKAGTPSYGRRFNDPENRACRQICQKNNFLIPFI
jgi:hypothetical protein